MGQFGRLDFGGLGALKGSSLVCLVKVEVDTCLHWRQDLTEGAIASFDCPLSYRPRKVCKGQVEVASWALVLLK